MSLYTKFAHILFIMTLMVAFQPTKAQSKAIDPNVAALLKSANSKFKQGDYLGARNEYQKIIQINPKIAEAYHNLGNVQYVLGNYEAALKNFAKTIELEPQDATPYCSRGAMYASARRYDLALKDINKAIELNPMFAVAYEVKASILHKLHKKVEACEMWKKAASLGNQTAEEKLAEYCEGLVEMPSKVPARGPKNSSDKNNLETEEGLIAHGNYLVETRDYKGAIQVFNQALEINPKSGIAYYGRGGAKFANGDYEGACKDWHKALDLGHKEAQTMIHHDCAH